MVPDREEITSFFRQLQDEICDALAFADGGAFIEDSWDRPGGGGGRARVIRGNFIEKGGVNFSAVHGELPPAAARSLETKPEETSFYATGVSIVLHPKNVHVPIIHMNVRYFELDGGRFWFGGGIDLTPHYVDREQARWFHQQLKDTCDAYDTDYYPRFKKWADDYFYLPHRNETRGVGGIFFDRLQPSTENKDKRTLFDFTAAVGRTFAPTYVHLMNLNKEKGSLGGRSTLATIAPGPLRRVQPRLGPRHEVWPDDQRPDGIHSDEFAATGRMDLRLPAHGRQSGRGYPEFPKEGRRLGSG
jgi:coproporphyrinogen III oxidase